MIVIIMPKALADLEQIGDFVALDNPRRAESFVTEMIDRCQRLVDAPEGFPLVPRYAASGIRRRSYGAYLIFYRVNVDQIELLHVLNGAQDYEKILFPKL